MRITRFEYQKNDSSRVNVYSDDGYEFSIHAGLLVKEQLTIGIELGEEQISELLRTDISYRLYSRAIDYLARGPKSIKQMSDHLKKVASERMKEWSTDRVESIEIDRVIDRTIERLLNEGLINDEEFGRQYIASLLLRRSYSNLELRTKLYRYGLSRDLIDRLITDTGNDELEMARIALEKKFHKTTLNRKDIKQIQFLQRKGYNWDVISQLLKDDI